ncbi:MAG: hypothetical protein JWN34_2039, partial [Bryobacterales bacterium]|nr:hypothetical protein [Bryobacterales bacterium]
DEKRGKVIVSFRLTTKPVPVNVRPGSFSIRREHFEVGKDYGLSGGMVFSHQPELYDRVAA